MDGHALGGFCGTPRMLDTLSRPWFSTTALSVMFGLVVIQLSASTPQSDHVTSA